MLALTLSLVAVALILYVHHLRITREVISDAQGHVYLIRYFILPRLNGFGRLYLHHFMRSDHDRAKHDHPWSFWSLILTCGYWEHADFRQVPDEDTGWEATKELGSLKKWFGPGSFLSRGGWWRHRVELPTGKTAWTLFYTSPKFKEWGFYPNDSFCHHRDYDTLTGLCRED